MKVCNYLAYRILTTSSTVCFINAYVKKKEKERERERERERQRQRGHENVNCAYVRL